MAAARSLCGRVLSPGRGAGRCNARAGSYSAQTCPEITTPGTRHFASLGSERGDAGNTTTVTTSTTTSATPASRDSELNSNPNSNTSTSAQQANPNTPTNTDNPATSLLPTTIDVAIIGGGVTGTSLHYHLAKRGVESMIIEKNELTSGATWHAAGLTTYFHGGNNFKLWHDYSVNLFKSWRLDGTLHSMHTPGSLRLIEKNNYHRLDEALHQRAKSDVYQTLFGCQPVHVIGVDEVWVWKPTTGYHVYYVR
jgi:hypothetical protein